MRKGQDRTGRSWLGLLGVSSFALLTGCGWFGGGGPPPGSAKLRPGADRQIQASSALPSANGQQYEQGISAADETRGQLPQIGAIVEGTGGQKAQREKADKESAERDAKAREARVEREAAEKEARAKEKEYSKAEPRNGPATGMPGKPAAAEPGNPDGVTKVTPAPAPGPPSELSGVASDSGALRRNARRRHGRLDARCHARRDDQHAGRRAAASATSA